MLCWLTCVHLNNFRTTFSEAIAELNLLCLHPPRDALFMSHKLQTLDSTLTDY